mgnify:CR=1 FL=1
MAQMISDFGTGGLGDTPVTTTGMAPTGTAPTGTAPAVSNTGGPNLSQLSEEQRKRILEMLAKIRGANTGFAGALGLNKFGSGNLDMKRLQQGTAALTPATMPKIPRPKAMAEGGKFPDLTGDGKTTYADILKGRGVSMAGGGIADVPLDQRYGRGGIFSALGRIAGGFLLSPFMGPVAASAVSSGVVSAIEGKRPEEIIGDAALAGLFSYGAGKLGEAVGLDDMLGGETVADTLSSVPGADALQSAEAMPELADLTSVTAEPEMMPVGNEITDPTYLQKLGQVPTSRLATSVAGEGIKAALTPEQPEPGDFDIPEVGNYTIQPMAPLNRQRADSGRTFYEPYTLGYEPQQTFMAAEGGPAKVNENDFVVTADVTSAIGDGDTVAGAQRLRDELGMGGKAGKNYREGSVVNSGLEGLVGGPGAGLDDLVQATIGGKQAARLSRGEFVVPKPVVQELGNGDLTRGHEKLYNLMKNVRKEKMGTSKQPGPLNRSLGSLMS